jgi:hypothetical protein
MLTALPQVVIELDSIFLERHDDGRPAEIKDTEFLPFLDLASGCLILFVDTVDMC